ncbi:histidine kinase [Croceiramulus getboli]|nr:histidine kinase [Flavobacteriaceae bacterium YJPT1-3]
MKCIRSFVLVVLMLLSGGSSTLLAQIERDRVGEEFLVRGSVLDRETDLPIGQVKVRVAGKSQTVTGADGEFRIRAALGDELLIDHEGFASVRYRITSKERIRLEVQAQRSELERADSTSAQLSFRESINAAKNSYKNNIAAGLEYVTKALEALPEERNASAKSAEAFALLGDIYMHYKQYDLAVTNYQTSLDNTDQTDIRMRLGTALIANKQYKAARILFQSVLDQKDLSGTQEKRALEGLGDVQLALGEERAATTNYKKALPEQQGKPTAADRVRLNTKIASAYDQEGDTPEAVNYYNKSLVIAEEEQDPKREAETKNSVADFLNDKQSYDAEIELREETLQALGRVAKDSIALNEPITAQKQNYKIANAYAAKREFDQAIPFLEKSIEQAEADQDIVVEKDATRRLSEVYRSKGEYDKAAASYERYVALVDEDYARKEQEIAAMARLNRLIAEKQNRILSLESDRALNQSKYELAIKDQELNEEVFKRQRILIISLLVFALLLLLAGYFMYRSMRQQRLANNLLALRSLRSQMNPHFIFNALNSVNSFIASSDERKANKYLSDFSRLMRSVLENSEEDFIPLEQEIELISNYVALEHFRFQDQFEYEITVDPDLDVSQFEIPPMLLQPYVENAVWHGLRYRKGEGHLSIHFKKEGPHEMCILVEDDGIGRTQSKALKTANQKKQRSKGMGNIEKRIQILNDMYGDRISVEIQDKNADGTGTQVLLRLKKIESL